ncbi:ADP-ribosylglycohydrolase family protein [Candidatus Enterococcus ferrettii]|nr:ADP-ribosylglycohydrolase family protein [Enterococcus sp. 665A]
MDTIANRIYGILAGGAFGDAFGMPTECWSREQIKEKFPDGIHSFLPSQNNELMTRELEPGTVTDDTMNTIMILRSIVKNSGSLSTEEYIKELSYWLENAEDAKAVSGPSTIRAIQLIQQGTPIEKSGILSTTNGAAMKITPIGIIADYKKMDDLIKQVYDVSLPTHSTNVALTGAAIIAACISYVVAGGREIEALWTISLETVDKCQNIGYDFPSPSLSYRISQAKTIVRESSPEIAFERIVNELGSGVQTIETIPAVLAIVELANGNPIKAAKLSAEIGFDTDTIGALSTSICGGMNNCFSEEDIRLIEECNNINFDLLVKEILPFCYLVK